MRRSRHWSAPALTILLTLAAVGGAQAGGAGCSASGATYSMAETMTTAATSDRLVLLKIGAEWCTACKAFDQAVASEAGFRTDLEKHVVLAQLDGEKGEGKELAAKYRVYGYPSFLLLNAKGEVLDRWVGYKDTAAFQASMTSALSDAVTMDARLARFQGEPNERDAAKIAELRQHDGLYAESIAYYRQAASLAKETTKNYDALVLGAMAGGLKQHIFGVADLRTQADRALASPARSEQDLIKVAYTMSRASMISEDKNVYLPYLQAAVEGTATSASTEVTEARSKLLPDYALFIEKDTDKAIAYKRASMPKDWEKQPEMLNNFAWWCFENKVNLDEAQAMARRGVDLCKPGPDRANILDTVAEICNLTGNCGDAVELTRQAIAEAPDNEYFKKQLTRFETLLANGR